MNNFIRLWKEVDIEDIEKHLVVAGELSSQCHSCSNPGIGLMEKTCPSCRTNFKYMGFRRKLTLVFLQKVKDSFPGITFIDFEDFKRSLNKRDARKLLDT